MNTLFVAWRSGDSHNGAWGPVGRLDYDGQVYRFCYTCGARTLRDFRPFPQMEDLEQVYESEELFPLFANRLLSPSRPEYEAFLRWGGFERNSAPDPIAVLGVTEGIRQTDAVEVFPCPDHDAEGCYANKFFLHGIRWMAKPAIDRINRLLPGEQLFPLHDRCNKVDPYAVAVRTDVERTLIGYVPRYMAREAFELLWQCDPGSIELVVDRVNLDAPMQQRVLCRMRACWPDDFRPCSDEEFQPISKSVFVRCEA